MPAEYPFLKGHGTENDFVLLPDPGGRIHGDLDPARVRALCDRRAGIGGDGVLRVVRTTAMPVGEPGVSASREAEWFMDYRNADGSPSQMCGNGIRLFARHLVEEGLADAAAPVPVGSRDGTKTVTVAGDVVTVDLGCPRVVGETEVAVGKSRWPAVHVETGNPHAVTWVDDLAAAGPLVESPGVDAADFPEGVNVEFAVRRGPRHFAMRVHERGSGETRSCGTGACAVAVAAAVEDGVRDAAYRVDVPGGTLHVTWTADGRVLLSGPAVVVARGTTSL